MLSNTLDRMERISNRIPARLAEYLYYLAFSLVLIYDYNYLTQFDREPFRIVYIIGAAVAVVVVCLRFLNVKNEGLSYAIVSAIMLFIGIGYFLFRHSYYFFVLAMLIVGARRIEAKKLLAVYLLIATTFFIVMMAWFLYSHGGATGNWRNTIFENFGSINTTDCQGMVFFLLMAYLFLKGEHIGYLDLIVLAGIVIWFWSHTHAEINMFCSLGSLLIAALMRTGMVLGIKPDKKKQKLFAYIISASFLILAVIMLILILKYDPDNAEWIRLNKLLHNRLITSHKIMLQYPPNIWGQDYIIVGLENSTPNYSELFAQYGYTFIDSSYPNILVMHGYLVFIMIMGIMTYVSIRYAKTGNLYYVLLLAVLAIDFAAESHMKEISCNIWLVFPFAQLLFEDQPSNIQAESLSS